MPTKDPRVNIVLDKATRDALAALAAARAMTLSSTAADLIRDALEVQEDVYFSRLAAARREEKCASVTHELAWKPKPKRR